jgi:DNA primase
VAYKEYAGTKPAVLIKTVLDRMFPPGAVFEVRIPKTRVGTISGYFDDTAIAAALIAKENGKHQAIYVTANPVDPSLLARNHNKFEYGSHTTTSDSEIVSRRWFLIDLDPVRAAGISSTAGELELARQRAEDIKTWLKSIDWPDCVTATSGNGYHLMYRVDEPNDEATRVEFEYATKMLASIFSDDKINVDTTVWNASRIWKLYGTIAAKGSDTADRPHRVAMPIDWPRDLKPVPRGLVENIARALKEAKADEFRDMTGEFIGDMQKWLTDRGQTVTSGPRPLYGNEGKKWTISRCPFNPQHDNPMVGLVNNRPVYRCLHNSCSAYRWKEFREKIDPSFKDPDTIYQRLKEWCEGDQEEADGELLESACRTGKKLDGILGRLKKEVPRARFLVLEELIKAKRRQFIKETIGENNEKGNIVGLINRTRKMQEEGIVPMFWVADYDHRIRVGAVGDIATDRLSENDEIALMVKFHSLGDSWVKQTHAGQVIRHLSNEYRVNPLRIMLKKFTWDGTKRLDTWLIDYLGTKDSVYTRAIGRKWMISAVARAMDPGCQVDHMLILEGAQGIGKSRALRILGGQFYTEYSGAMKGTGTNHKDMVAVILGKMIVEMSELATLRKADMESLKATLTTTIDDARLSYERDAKSYPRTCVFAGTTNEVGNPYIADISGARRFWPTVAGEVSPVRSEALKEVRDQLWAEAVEAYESGEDWWVVPVEEVAHEQADRQISVETADPWYLKIRHALTNPEYYNSDCFHYREEFIKGAATGDFIVRAGSLHAVLQIVVGVEIERQGPMEANRIRNIYRALGFKKVRPQGGWVDSTYAYDLHKSAAPHLWPAIAAAISAAKQQRDLSVQVKAEEDKKRGP